ncbi:MAG: acyl-CoA dehydrogenase family protein [Caulobacteraceae bacterium]|nr:acyl-CoA dehydrogenase family protein [Caulobacteraceae bacterium]
MFDTLALSAIPPEDEAVRPAIRALIAEACAGMSLHDRAHTWMGASAEFSRKMGAAGFLGLTLPKAYGGHERGPFARFVVVEELLAAGAPVALHWIADRQSALVILNYGTEAQKQQYLPPICRGEIFFCIGMSEPGSGSDLASVRTRAERTAAGWRLNGQKIWTTNAHLGHYAITLVRTSGDATSRHAGLSQLIVDLHAPGVSIRPIRDLNGETDFNEIFFDNVELPADALLGEEGAGWEQVNAELAFERSGPERIYSTLIAADGWVRHVQALGVRAGEDRLRLAGSLMAQLAVLRQISIAVTARLAKGERPLTEASLSKDLGTSFEQSIPHLIADDLASHPDEPIGADLRAALMHLMQISPAFSLRGGTREIMRGIIARGLGLR